MEKTKMWDYICSECGSDFILWDATASWSTDKQKFMLESTYDHCECGECESTSIDDVELKPVQDHGPPYSMANTSGYPIESSKEGIQEDPEC